MRTEFICEQCFRTEDSDNAVIIDGDMYCLDCVDFERDEDGTSVYFVKPIEDQQEQERRTR